MPTYRVYALIHQVGEQDIEAPNEVEAIKLAFDEPPEEWEVRDIDGGVVLKGATRVEQLNDAHDVVHTWVPDQHGNLRTEKL